MQPTMNRQQACLGRSAMAVREESVWKLLADTHETASHFRHGSQIVRSIATVQTERMTC
jgi:hypothetical protein